VKQAIVLSLIAVILVCSGAAIVFGQGLIGERYILAKGGAQRVLEDSTGASGDYNDYNPVVAVRVNVPWAEDLDFHAAYEYQKISWKWGDRSVPWANYYDWFAEAHFFTGGFTLHTAAHDIVELFISPWAGAVTMSLHQDIFGHTNTDFVWGLNAGAEILTGGKAAVRPTVGVQQIHGGDGDTETDGLIQLDFNYWIINRLALVATGTLTTDEKIFGLLGGLGVQF
jgi:hypothetical protein